MCVSAVVGILATMTAKDDQKVARALVPIEYNQIESTLGDEVSAARSKQQASSTPPHTSSHMLSVCVSVCLCVCVCS